jgi:hypothetical protein
MRRTRHRKFVPPWQWGIFYWKPSINLSLASCTAEHAPIIAIYQTLKSMGFKETRWQFVYPGQIGGLIKNPRSTLLEFHVRFFSDGLIYAEIEIGRSGSLHLIDRRMYINNYLIGKMGSSLAQEHLEYFRTASEKAKLVYPKNWPEWSSQNRFMTPSIKTKIQFLSVLADWRVLALVMMASIVSSIVKGVVLIPLLTAIMIFVYVLAPKRT